MSDAERGGRSGLSPADKLLSAVAAFSVTLALASSVPDGHRQSLAEHCRYLYPPQTPGLTMNDYLGVQKWGGEYHATPESERKNVLEIIRGRLRRDQLHSYEVSAERAQRIEAHVNRFAAGMVERANDGDKTYKFLQGGGGAFLDGSFVTGPGGGLEPAPDNYEGFGWLWRDVKDGNSKIVKQEIVDNIYRRSDGTYYEHPHPWILSVSDKNAQSTFEAPPALGLDECASVPGNGATQGWRVSHYDFNHLGEPGFHTVQIEPWAYGNTTLADVQLADRRANHFIEDRYNPYGP